MPKRTVTAPSEAREVLDDVLKHLNQVDELLDYAAHVDWDDPRWKPAFAKLRKKNQRAGDYAGLLSLVEQQQAKATKAAQEGD